MEDQQFAKTSAPTEHQNLRVAYERNVAAGRPPYAEVTIRTSAEVTWILSEHSWSGAYDLPEGKERADLKGANFGAADLAGTELIGADLRGANFIGAKLSDADLSAANLTGSFIIGANLSGTSLEQTDLRDASLGGVDLRGADLRFANLAGSSLVGANLAGADLSGADLSGADLREVRLDTDTNLSSVKLAGTTHLLDVRWNGVSITRVDWEAVPRLGDEVVTMTAKGRKARVTACREAARSYRGLALVLQSQGLLIPASRYRLREQLYERKALFWEGRVFSWIFSWMLYLVAGYGELPARSVVAYLLVIFGFAAVYWVLGPGEGHIFSPQAALVFSITSFHGRGFFPGGLSLEDGITQIAALEAVLGLFIELTFIATFTQRFLGTR